MAEKLYFVGIYTRLSHESGNYRNTDESFSIENQITMLQKFVEMMPDWIETRIYIDDGATGGNFNRKGFQDMMNDVKSGVINLVLVKDLSRFGRNYLETGRYLEEELPSLGCRFVALTDNIDTKSGENDILPFLNAINDFYIKDISKKIRSVMKEKAKNGHWLTGIPPYGYDRDTNQRSQLIIDDYAATVVKRIFSLRALGMGYFKIVSLLNNDKILPPRLYHYHKQRRVTKAITSEVWTIFSVRAILHNEVYIGNTVSLKRGSRSYRDKRTKKRDESEWIRVNNTHPPIISINMWDNVQEVNQSSKKTFSTRRKPQTSLFSGLLFCSNCGVSMGYKLRKVTKKDGDISDYSSYYCRTHTKSGQSTCSSHIIQEFKLKSLVLEHIQSLAVGLTLDESDILVRLKKSLLGKQNVDKIYQTCQRNLLEQKRDSLEFQIDQLYEKKVFGVLSAEKFAESIRDVEVEQNVVIEMLEALNKDYKDVTTTLDNITKWSNLIKEAATISEVDREVLTNLIDRIEIGERIVINNKLTQDVTIYSTST